MNTINRSLSSRLLPSAALALAVAMASAPAMAEDVYLRAEPFNKLVPDGSGVASITMWGYTDCTAAVESAVDVATGYGACSSDPQSPGPVIRVTIPGDDLNIYVQNQLSIANGNITNDTSIVIPALPKALTPATWPPASWSGAAVPTRNGRIYSFDTVVAEGDIATYSWTAPAPGTYMYQSGTHAQVQVQMGLYGAVVVDASGTNTAYEATTSQPAVTYTQDATLVFSEIDPALHTAVADGSYGGSGPTSTEDYKPRFFLINGETFDAANPPLLTSENNTDILLRLVNAGLENHAPQLLGDHFEVIAQDGRRAPTSRSQHTLLLPAGKTQDILFHPTALSTYTLFDRHLRTVNSTGLGGGMMVQIGVANSGVTPGSVAFSTVGGGNANAIPGVDGPFNDSDIYSWDGSVFSRLIDGTDIGLPNNADIDGASAVAAGHYYFSFFNGNGGYNDVDVVEHDNGSWSVWFDGTAAGLTANSGQDIDAVSVVDGVLYFSTLGNVDLPGVARTGPKRRADIYSWNGSVFAREFDANSVSGLSNNANIDGLTWVDADTFYVSFNANNTTVPGLGAVQDEDIVLYDAGTWTLYFDGTALGLTNNGQDLDAIQVNP